jgi:UDP:flavonoid glycosyltransferase YjiC (YdhE family)
VRVLITSNAAHGHFYQLVPYGWALRAAGHEVLVAVAPTFCSVVKETGLAGVAVGRELLPGEWPQPAPDTGREEKLVLAAGRGWSLAAGHAADDLAALARDWRPDLVLHESLDYTGPFVAALTGVPAVSVRCVLHLPSAVAEVASEQLRPLYERFHIAPAPSLMELDPVPPSLQLLDATPTTPVAYVPFTGSRPAPRWCYEPLSRRRVVLTLGSIHNPRAKQVLESVAAVVGEFDVELVVAVGQLAAKPRLPEGSIVAPWLPLSEVVPRSDLFISQGGLGGTLTAVRAGVPQLMLPQMGEQYRTAGRIHDTGVGINLDVAEPSAEELKSALADLLAEPKYREAAARMRDELLAQPEPAAVVGMLEGVA